MIDENKEIFANNLKRYMEINSVSQSDLTVDLGFKQSTISDWITAKKFPRIDKIETLANYFGILKSDLLEDKSGEVKSNIEIENNDTLTYHLNKYAALSKKSQTVVDSLTNTLLEQEGIKIENTKTAKKLEHDFKYLVARGSQFKPGSPYKMRQAIKEYTDDDYPKDVDR